MDRYDVEPTIGEPSNMEKVDDGEYILYKDYKDLERLRLRSAELIMGHTADRVSEFKSLNRRLHRRCQRAESAVKENVEECKRQGVGLGRTLANAAYKPLEEENSNLVSQIETLKKEVSDLEDKNRCLFEEATLLESECERLDQDWNELFFVGQKIKFILARLFGKKTVGYDSGYELVAYLLKDKIYVTKFAKKKRSLFVRILTKIKHILKGD